MVCVLCTVSDGLHHTDLASQKQHMFVQLPPSTMKAGRRTRKILQGAQQACAIEDLRCVQVALGAEANREAEAKLALARELTAAHTVCCCVVHLGLVMKNLNVGSTHTSQGAHARDPG